MAGILLNIVYSSVFCDYVLVILRYIFYGTLLTYSRFISCYCQLAMAKTQRSKDDLIY